METPPLIAALESPQGKISRLSTLDPGTTTNTELADLREVGRRVSQVSSSARFGVRRALDTNDDAELRSSRLPVCSQGCE
jgi:hypothetical protein